MPIKNLKISHQKPKLSLFHIVDTTDHPATKRLPKEYLSPSNEFYRWIPSPRLNKDIQVLVTLDPAQYPFGKKDFNTPIGHRHYGPSQSGRRPVLAASCPAGG